jgi:hypothetical protein
VSLIFNGTIDPTTKRFSGTVTSADGVMKGTFTGQPYGPRAAEFGIIFRFEHPGNGMGLGAITGRQ